MVRRPRIEFPGAVYHITSRGNGRADIYLSDEDRRVFLKLLGEVVERHRWILHAYCLMSNHYHLLVETPEANLGRGMQVLSGTYTQRFNRRHGKVGHVFQGRYKAMLVEKESHLLEVARYVVRNPVEAGMAASAGDYEWSSFHATAGKTGAPDWLTTAWLLGRFHPGNTEAAKRAYVRFVERAAPESPYDTLKGGIALGTDEFIESLKPLIEESATRDKSARVREGRPALGAVLGAWSDKGERNRAMRDAFDAYGFTLVEIGAAVGLHPASVSRVLKEERGK